MKSETLQFSGTLDEAAAMSIARILNAVDGVQKVAIATATASVDINFDEDVTSVQELHAALQKAGVGMSTRGHKEAGMCCGSCGS